MAGSQDDDLNEFYFKQGSCSIILKQGNILEQENLDAIIVPAPPLSEPNPDSFVLYKAFYSEADAGFRKDIERMRGKLSMTSPQILSKRDRGYIFVATPYFGNPDRARDLLKKIYTSSLEFAAKNDYRKIAFPTIGCGISGFPILDATRAVCQTLESFLQTKQGKKMSEIRLIVFDQQVWPKFTSSFMDFCDLSSSKIKPVEMPPRNPSTHDVPSERDRKQTSQRSSQEGEPPQHYEDDFVDTERDRFGNMKRHTSQLNPKSPEFRPNQNNFQQRPTRRYLINNDKTELIIFQGDILRTKVDAIVNAANESMLGGGGVDGVIHRAAGDKLRVACKAHKEIRYDVRLPTGRSRILLSYNMSDTTYYIINTSGPRYDDYEQKKCKEQLTSCYKTSLALANLYDLETIGYTAISCGIFGYPTDEGAEVALETVAEEAGSMKKIFFVLRDDHIYDAWIKKAKELNFTSLDDNDSGKRVISKASPSDKRNTVEKPNPDQDRTLGRESSELNVTDDKNSTTNKAKSSTKTSSNEDPNQLGQSTRLNVIDGSTPDDAHKTRETDHEKSPKKSSPSPTEEPNNTNTVENDDNDNARNTDSEMKDPKSNENKSNSSSKEKPPRNSSDPRQTQDQDQKPSSSIPPTVGTNKSIVNDGRGRGKKSQNNNT